MKNIRCFADFFDKSHWRIFHFSIGSGYYHYREKSGKDPPAIMFFCSTSSLIQSGSILSCLAAGKRFLSFEGPGSFIKKEKFYGNVE
jgi:hypothetical protein